MKSDEKFKVLEQISLRAGSHSADERNNRDGGMILLRLVFLIDVDNTSIDNDRTQNDLERHPEREFGATCRDRLLGDSRTALH
jgi:hypothetical protein